MKSAILEILFLLSVSCFIGFFFTYRYWKGRYDDVQNQIRQLWVNLSEKNMQIKALEGKPNPVVMDSKPLPVKDIEVAPVTNTNVQESEVLTIIIDDQNDGELVSRLEKAEKALEEEKAKNTELNKRITLSSQSIVENKEVSSAKKATSLPKDKKEIKELKASVLLMSEELNEKEREIEALSQELSAKKISYYKQIDGKRYKAITLKMADEAVSGQGDGRISMDDAEQIFATISDGVTYTQVEKHTMKYLRDNYKWTEGADQLFRTKVRSWAAKGHHLD